MVAIFTGSGTGFDRGSGSVLGSMGLLGTSGLGRSGEQLFFNAATGNFMVSQRDEFLVGLGLDAAVSRTYNSLGDLSDDNGDNWRQGYDRRIVNLTGTLNTVGSTVQRVSGDGSVITYNWDATKSAYVATNGSGAYDTLTSSAGNWTWTDGDSQVKETYSGAVGWKIVSQSDADGNTISFAYDGGGRLSQVTTADGSKLTYTWSGNNNLLSVATSYDAGVDRSRVDQVYRLYDAAYDRIPDPPGLKFWVDFLRGGKTAAQLADAVYNSSEYAARGVASMSNQQYVDFLYQSVLRRTASTSERDAHVANLVNGSVTRSGLLLTFADAPEHVQVMTTIPGRTFSGTLTLTRTSYTYDGQNRLSTARVDLTPEDNVLDTNGNSIIEASEGYLTTYSYVDAASRKVSRIAQSDGSQIDITYDGSGRVATMVQTASSGVTRTTSVAYGTNYTDITDPLGLVTRLEYDAINGDAVDGSLTKITLPPATAGGAQQVIQFGYNGNGDVTGVTDALGNATTYAFDANGNATSVLHPDGRVSIRTYNAANQLQTETLDANRIHYAAMEAGSTGWQYLYDPSNIRTLDPPEIGIASGSAYAKGYFAATAAGQIVSIGSASSERFVVRAGERLSAQVGVAAAGAVGSLQLMVHFFDASGAYISGTAVGTLYGPQAYNTKIGGFVTPPAGAVSAFVELYCYTSGAGTGNFSITQPTVTAASPTQTGFPSFNSVGGSIPATTRFAYDSENHLRYLVSAEGSVTEYRYTTAGQILFAIEYPEQFYDVSGLAPGTSLSEIQLNSWVSGISDKSSSKTTAYTYDARGNLTSTTNYSLADSAQYPLPAEGTTVVSFVYDQNGKLLSRQTSGRNIETFVYDGLNRLKAAVDVNGATTTYVFNDAATTTTVTYATGLTQVSTYNKAGELISFAETATATTLSASVGTATYGYDKNGRLRWSVDATGNKSYFVYDQLGRKVADISSLGDVIEYRYDANNRLVATLVHGARYTGSFTALDNADAVIDPATYLPGSSIDDLWSWTVYDKEGRVVQLIDGDGSTSVMTYDGAGRLTQTLAYGYKLSTAVLGGFKTTAPTTIAIPTAPPPPPPPPPPPNQLPDLSNETQWTETNNLTQTTAATINGNPAWLYKAAAGDGRQIVEGNLTASAGDTLTWTMTLMATAGSQPSHFIGIWTSGGNNSPNGLGAAVIASGPGTLTQDASGMWTISGLSTTQATTVTFTHTFASNDTVDLSVFVDASGNKSGGFVDEIILSNPIVNVGTPAPTPPVILVQDSVARNFYDKDGRLTGVLDGEGYLTLISYDKAGQKVSETRFFNATSAAQRATGTLNQLVASITPSSANDRTVNYSYNGQGQLRYVIDSLGYVTQTDYDSAGQATTVIQYAAILPATSDYTFDNVKALIASGNLAASVGTRTSWTVYDMAGRAAYAIDAENAVTAFTYNAAGQLIKTVQFAMVRTTPSLPSKATMDAWALTPGNLSPANDRVTRFYYDGAGVLRYTVDGEGYISRIDYDAEGRETHRIKWNNQFTVQDSANISTLTDMITMSGSGWADSWTGYDVLGRVTNTTNAEGIIDRWYYNANGTLAYEVHASGTADEAKTAYYYFYDGSSRVKERHDAWQTSDEAVTQFTYDSFGNVQTITDPLGKVTTRNYDKAGQLLTETDPLNGVVTYQYDAFGSVVKVTDKLGASTFNYYDKRGQLVSVRDAEDYVTATTYTAFGQVDTVTRRYNKATGTAVVETPPTVTAHAKDAVTDVDYDRLGRVIKTTDAEGKFEVYGLDAFGNRISVTNKIGGIVTNTYDRRGLLTAETLQQMYSWRADGTVQATSVTNKFEYDARGNRTKMIEAFGLTEQRTTNYVYDKLNRLTSKTLDAVTTVSYTDFTSSTGVTVTTSTGVIPTESYIYDALGRLKQVTDALGGRTVSFYDDLGRKTDEVGPLGTMTHWTYDAAGNMLTAKVYGDAVAVPLATATAAPAPINGSNYRETVYTYDELGRLKTTKVTGVLQGSWNGSTGVAPTTVAVTTTYDYDANGNLITVTDPNAGKIYSYYDRIGRKTAQVDAEKYLTSWSYDAEGNVLSETRNANVATGTIVTTAPPTVTANATSDRITSFTYDRTGHRLTETRTGVKIATVNTTNGTVTQSTVSSAIVYTYNGLGQVLTKAEATGDTVTYTYDVTGRLTKESRAAYDDYVEPDSTTVTPTVEYFYNGLNNLSRTRQGEATAMAGDRITTYAYGANGRLASLTDPVGAVHSYDYDSAGNIVRDSYTRTRSDGTTVNEGILYRRDLLGRVTVQAIATKNSATSWTRGDGQNTAYNAWGDVSSRGVNGLWQESNTYNNRGLIEKTNSGDGVWRFFVYDKNGNKTLTIESEGTDLSGLTLTQALALAQPGGVAAGSAFVDGLNVSVVTYDKRGQALSTIMTQRETTAIGSSLATITNSQAYNAFGEVKSQTDALGNATTFTYNTMGRLIQKVMPTVSVTSAAGVVSNATPTENYFYDVSGRLVATQDANGNTISRTLLAGSGYGDAEALVAAEYHLDGGIARTFYDKFGDARISRNELNLDETFTYDAMGRVTNIVRRTGLKEDFTYDLLGQRLKHTLKDTANTVLGTDTTDYDLQGRVTSTVDAAGDKTVFAYAWNASISTALGTSGGWTKTTTGWQQLGSSLWKTKTETTDVHGLTTQETDFGGNTTSYTFDKAGRLTQKVGTAGSVVTTLTYTSFNTGLVATVADSSTGLTANNITSTFAYDQMGRRTGEKYFASTLYKSISDGSYTTLTGVANQTLQDATITYDALGRLATFSSTSSTGSVTVNQYYDAAGNIRRTQTTYPNILTGGTTSTDKWFTYDAMNRMVIADGVLSGGVISGGSSLTYDVVGNRKTATKAGVLETYNYDADGQVTTVVRGGSTIASTTRDIRGRVTDYVEYATGAPGGIASHRYNIVYNARGQVTSDQTFHWMNGGTDYTATVTNQYDSYGNMTRMDSVNDNSVKDTWQSWTYAWKDQAVVSTSDFDRETWDSNNNLYHSWQFYDGLGRLQRAQISDGRARDVHYALDADGLVLSRVQNDGQATNDPREYHLFVGGRQIADYTNDANEDVRNYDYQQLITSQAQPGAGGTGRFYQGTSFGTSGGELGTSGYDPINSITAGTSQSSRSRYTVQSGDTLEGIAASLWGDSSLWFLIADANGLTAGASLAAGQSLSIPLKGPSNRNNADMFRPYDASSAVGDLSPTSAKPPKNKKCGMMGAVLLVAIAVAVTVITAGAAAAAAAPGLSLMQGVAVAFGGTVAGVSATTVGLATFAAVGAAAGSVVSQGVGIAAGVQDKFSWKGVALAALGGAIGGALGPVTGLQGATGLNGVLQGAARGAAASALTQGVSVATGLQKRFDWAGVAAAGVAGGVSTAVGQRFSAQSLATNNSLQNHLANAATSAAGAMANAAVRSLVRGTDFGDNLLAALPDIIGQTIGGMIANGVAGRRSGAAVPAEAFSGEPIEVLNTPSLVGSVDLGALAAPGISFGVAFDPAVGAGGGQVGSVSAGGGIGNSNLIVDSVGSIQGGQATSRWLEFIVGNAGNPDVPAFIGQEKYGFDNEMALGVTEQLIADSGQNAAYLEMYVQPSVKQWASNEQFGGPWAVARDQLQAYIDTRNAMADQATLEFLRPALGPVDTGMSAYSITQGRGTVGDYVNVIAAVAGPLGRPLGKAVSKLGAKAISFATASRLAVAATHNPGSKVVMLGKFAGGEGYTRAAENIGATYFSADAKVWDKWLSKYGQEGVDDINRAFIKKQVIDDGKDVYFSHNPAQATDSFAMEVRYLRELGVQSFEKTGPYWKAVW